MNTSDHSATTTSLSSASDLLPTEVPDQMTSIVTEPDWSDFREEALNAIGSASDRKTGPQGLMCRISSVLCAVAMVAAVIVFICCRVGTCPPWHAQVAVLCVGGAAMMLLSIRFASRWILLEGHFLTAARSTCARWSREGLFTYRCQPAAELVAPCGKPACPTA